MVNNLFTEKKNKPEEVAVESAINVEDVSKSFRLHTDRSRSFKEAVLRGPKKNEYKTFWALNDVSFEVKKGTTVGIVGENGSGKSTLLKILTKVYKPTKGEADINGKASGLLELGAGFHPELTGRENVYLNASILGLKKKEVDEKFDQIVDFSEIEEFIDTPVKHYSSGMFVRLGFAVAINVNPDILLIDEVLAVGDEHFQRKCNEKILEFKRQKKTIIIVSHALEELRTLCDEAVWLHKGKLRAFGKAGKVIDAYLKNVNVSEEELADDRAKQQGKLGSRWGSGEAVITGVEFKTADGKQKSVFKTGEPLIVKIGYKADKKIEKPVFGFAVHSNDGLHLSGPNTRLSGEEIKYIEGEGEVEYRIEAMPFLKGRYLCSAAIYDHSCLHPYDHHEEMYTFEIIDGPIKETYGVVHVPAQWKVKQ